MNAATITAIITGIPAILAAVTALIWALRGKTTAKDANIAATHAYTTASQALALITIHATDHKLTGNQANTDNPS